MAIHSTLCTDRNRNHTAYAMRSSKVGDLAISPLEVSISSASANSKHKRRKIKNNSVFLCNNSIQLRSLIGEKSQNKVVSSFQLAAKLYKSNSAEFKMTNKRSKKSNKKSVLTLPNEPAILPQSCTVSDMNDTEYFSHIHKTKPHKTKKRQIKKIQKPSNYNYEYYDRDAAYCSQMNVYLDCDSVDVVKNYKGDRRRKKRRYYDSKNECDEASSSDVWAVLRNINRFQFNPSPPMSDDSSFTMKPRNKKMVKKKLSRGIYEECRTEEIAYFSSIECKDVDISRGDSLLGSSQVTVIDNRVDLSRVNNNRSLYQKTPRINPKNRRKELQKNNNKRIINRKPKSISTNKIFASIDTLVCPKSKEKICPEQTTSQCEDMTKGTLRNNVCSTVEVQTETQSDLVAGKEIDELHIDPQPHLSKCVANSGTVSDSPLGHNPLRQDVKMTLRKGPSFTRVPWRSAQRGAEIPSSGRPMPASPKTLTSPHGLTFSKLQDNPRVPFLTTEDTMQPLTQTAIRKLLSKIKFPLVILGREQVSGKFEVEQYDYPQFRGLDEHVWPFMVNWMDKPKSLKLNTVAPCIKQTLKNKTNTLPDNVYDTIRNRKETCSTHKNVECKQNHVAVIKPAPGLQNHVLKFLNKSADQTMGKVQQRLQRDAAVNPLPMKSTNARTGNCKSLTIKTDDKAVSSGCLARTSSSKGKEVEPKFSSVPPPTSPSKILLALKKPVPPTVWSKAKLTSDFIENVINKIKSGIYYTDNAQVKDLNSTSLRKRTNDTSDLRLDSKEVSIQVTMSTFGQDFTPKVTIQKKKELCNIKLPGFDEFLPQLEIKSMSRSQIAVKNCVMNILLQFDVNIPQEVDRSASTLKRSPSCSLLTVTNSKTKIFKCKTRIINALLPAELCSIIPKVMMQILSKDTSMGIVMQDEKINASLSTISEIQEPLKFPLLPQINMSPELIWLMDGNFAKNPKLWEQKSNSNENFYIISIKELPFEFSYIEGMLSLQLSKYRHVYYEAQPRCPLLVNTSVTQSSPKLSCIDTLTKPNLCTDLVLYQDNNVACGGSILQNWPLIALNEFFDNMLNYNTSSISDYIPAIQVQTNKSHVYVNFSINNQQGAFLCIDTTYFKYEPLYNISITNSSTSIVNTERPVKQIEYIKHAVIKQSNRTEMSKSVGNVAVLKTKKKGFVRYVKLYKKCKSTSHIVAERSSTPLNKITNLDEFFEALGTAKHLSSVFDGISGKKILTCISNMKSYISGITPRQALLVMLLANKKDTPNLVRFRPMILQGIAVHRITRVSELDLEVEVIAKEKLNKMQEYLDISSLTVSPQNNDNLLEELIWIAKTTASDHQRRFDQSSEKLLKKLLDKRKRLNPSYLRVMARYVGLGLLKTPS